MIKTILVVEDEKDLQDYLVTLLSENDYSVQTAFDGVTALKMLEKSSPDLVVLDLGLPNLSGESVCIEIRKKYPQLPIIILTAKDDVSDIVRGLGLGADDYMTKPFEGEELLARIKARMRSRGEDIDKLKIADLELDNTTFEVKRAKRSIKLTPTEFKLLQYLMKNQGRVLNRDMILNRIWLFSPEIETRAVDVYVGYLRKKIDSGFKKKLILSVRGFGYMIKD